MKRIGELILITILFMPINSTAQEPAGEMADIFAMFEEERMVVTASRYQQEISRAPVIYRPRSE